MINISKLQNVRIREDGATLAHCPVCAEEDKTGDNLIIYPSGKFTCLAHLDDGVHRQQIFALAGERLRPTVRPFQVCEPKILIKNIFSRLTPSPTVAENQQQPKATTVKVNIS